MIETIKQTITERRLFDPTSPVLLMVSGGSDSTALAYIASELQECGLVGPLACLHVNHLLRGEDAAADAHFVEELASMLGIPCFTCEVDVALLAREAGGNLEAIGRQERYLAAQEALESLCFHTSSPLAEGRILVAHTQDDRVENFYMRSIKGTGPGGFRSMRYANGAVARPLLDVSRESLRAYIEARAGAGLPVVRDGAGALWREDATNAHTDRFRAFVRHNIIPLAKEQNPQLLDTLCRTMNLIATEDDFMERLALDALVQQTEAGFDNAELEEGGEEQKPDYWRLLPSFGALDVALQRRVLRIVLESLLGQDARIEAASIEAILAAFSPAGLEDPAPSPISGYVANIQGNLAVSANKQGVLIEPMARFRARRKRD